MDETSNEYLSAHGKQIGRLVIGVGLFDSDITDIISQSLRLNTLQENALLRPMTTRGKVDLLNRIAKLFLKGPDIKAVSRWCETTKGALDERNSLIHGAPGHIDGKVHFRTWTGKNRMIGKPEAWPAERVSELADQFNDLDIELEERLLPLFRPTFAPAEPPKENDSQPA